LAALVLAHHLEFQGPFKARTADRVERLFQILGACAHPVNVGDPRRTGFGIPDVLSAIGLAPYPAMAGMRGLFSPYPLAAQMAALGFGSPISYQHTQTPVGVW